MTLIFILLKITCLGKPHASLEWLLIGYCSCDELTDIFTDFIDLNISPVKGLFKNNNPPRIAHGNTVTCNLISLSIH